MDCSSRPAIISIVSNAATHTPLPSWVIDDLAIQRPCRLLSAVAPTATFQGMGRKGREVPIANIKPDPSLD
jgi:hypothetical protein